MQTTAELDRLVREGILVRTDSGYAAAPAVSFFLSRSEKVAPAQIEALRLHGVRRHRVSLRDGEQWAGYVRWRTPQGFWTLVWDQRGDMPPGASYRGCLLSPEGTEVGGEYAPIEIDLFAWAEQQIALALPAPAPPP